jgi:hypothetical protein
MNQFTRPINRTTPFADLTVPPDPDGHNVIRAQRARAAIDHYRSSEGYACTCEDAVIGLLTDLMHFYDRSRLEDGKAAMNFFSDLHRAFGYYGMQTTPRAVPSDADEP